MRSTGKVCFFLAIYKKWEPARNPHETAWGGNSTFLLSCWLQNDWWKAIQVFPICCDESHWQHKTHQKLWKKSPWIKGSVSEKNVFVLSWVWFCNMLQPQLQPRMIIQAVYNFTGRVSPGSVLAFLRNQNGLCLVVQEFQGDYGTMKERW